MATVLSAQATDVSVNQITPGLFRRWPTPALLAGADVAEVELALNRIGMFRQKARNVTRLAQQLVEEHGGQVPRTLDALTQLAGVGRKTANVVLGVAFGLAEGVVVDTHVQRLAQRLGWSSRSTPDLIEADLIRIFPRSDWPLLSHTLIFHGRRVCTARAPQCETCPVTARCPSAFKAEQIGRKPPRVRSNGSELSARAPRPAVARRAPRSTSSARKLKTKATLPSAG